MTIDFKRIDFSHEYYRGYNIRVDALANSMRIEKDGILLTFVPRDESWMWAREWIDRQIEVAK